MHPFRPTIHARISSCSATLRAPCSSMNRYSSRLEVSPSLFCVEGPHPSTQLYCYSQSYTDAHSRYSDQFGFHSHWSLVASTGICTFKDWQEGFRLKMKMKLYLRTAFSSLQEKSKCQLLRNVEREDKTI